MSAWKKEQEAKAIESAKQFFRAAYGWAGLTRDELRITWVGEDYIEVASREGLAHGDEGAVHVHEVERVAASAARSAA